jgi:hypothetical protein
MAQRTQSTSAKRDLVGEYSLPDSLTKIPAETYLRLLEAEKQKAVEWAREAGLDPEYSLPNYGRLSGLFVVGPPNRAAGSGSEQVLFGDITARFAGRKVPLNIEFADEKYVVPPHESGKKPIMQFRDSPASSTMIAIMMHLKFLFVKSVQECKALSQLAAKRIVPGRAQPKRLSELMEEILAEFYSIYPYYSSESTAPNYFNPRHPNNFFVYKQVWDQIRAAWPGHHELQALCSDGSEGSPVILRDDKIPNPLQTEVQVGKDAGLVLDNPIFRPAFQIVSDDKTSRVNAEIRDANRPVKVGLNISFERKSVTPSNLESLGRGTAVRVVIGFSVCSSQMGASMPSIVKYALIEAENAGVGYVPELTPEELAKFEARLASLKLQEGGGGGAGSAGGASGGAGSASGGAGSASAGAGAGSSGDEGGGSGAAGEEEAPGLGASELADLGALVGYS